MREVSQTLTLQHFLKGIKLLSRAHPTFFVALAYLSVVGALGVCFSWRVMVAVFIIGFAPIMLLCRNLQTKFHSRDLRAQFSIVMRSARISQAMLGLMMATIIWLVGPGDELGRSVLLVSIVAIVVMGGAFALTVAIHGWMADQFQSNEKETQE